MNKWIYILIMGLTTFVIRALPMTLIRKQITNRTVRSFLYYVPYVTLSVMTFPAIVEATSSPLAGMLALIAGIVASYRKVSLVGVAVICCLVVLIVESVIL
ncbi:MAG: AzlD domain-containing protein [Erysipelotrichaceae bacterium]|nr:AzlD domain-containing protein [Erysipelotrichaceae bacterium]